MKALQDTILSVLLQKVILYFISFCLLKLTEHCTAIAYHGAQPFYIVCKCNVEQYVLMTEAYLRGALYTYPDPLTIDSITLINVIDEPVSDSSKPVSI